MKIAVFYSGYLPGEKYGGPVTSLYNFTELLGDEHEIFIICSNHDLNDKTPYTGICNGWNDIGKAKVLYLQDSEFTEKCFRRIVNNIQPDFLYVSSIFSARIVIPVLGVSKKMSIPVLLAPRGELNDTAIKRNFKAPKKLTYLTCLKLSGRLKNTFYQATSIDEKSNIKKRMKVGGEKVFLLPNIPTLPVNKKEIKKDIGTVKICFVGRIVENKNLLYAIESVKAANCNVLFDIYGPRESLDYWEKCNEAIRSCPPNIVIEYKGAVAPSIMKDKYADYDCFISPTMFENYGQSIVESMLHDTPVIISRGTTPWDDINDYKAGVAIDLADKDLFTKTIEEIADMNLEDYKALIDRLRDYCSVKFNYNNLREEYNKAFVKVIE